MTMDTNAVLDASAFTEGLDLWAISKTLMTTTNVIEEVRTNHEGKYRPISEIDDMIKYKDDVIQPETVMLVTDFAKQTGDYTSLTDSDIFAIALTYELDLHTSHDHHSRVRKMPRVSRYSGSGAEYFLNRIYRPYNTHFVYSPETPIATECTEESEEEDIGSDLELFKSTTVRYEPAAGCITTKFAVQSVLLQMGLYVFTPEGKSIEQLRRIIRQCPRPCLATSDDLKQRSCPICGNESMKVMGAFIDRKDFAPRTFTNMTELRQAWTPRTNDWIDRMVVREEQNERARRRLPWWSHLPLTGIKFLGKTRIVDGDIIPDSHIVIEGSII